MAPECIILIGLPGAGKSTLVRAYFAATHVHLSLDLWPNGRRRQVRLQQALRAALAERRPVVIDNVNASRLDRAPLIAIAREHQARVIGYYFDVSTRQAVARNAERRGRARVPPVAIFTAARRLEAPSFDEGFDQLFRVVVPQVVVPQPDRIEVQELEEGG